MGAQKILIMEDEAPLRQALVDKLKSAGYEVVTAANGETGLTAALEERPALILLDLLMPKLDGQRVLHRLRQNSWGKAVPVIVLSNKDANQDIFSALQQGTLDYFIKADTSLNDLLGVIKDRLAKPAA